MNNEELILQKLNQISTDISGIKTDVADLKTDVADLKTRVTKIELTQENVILPRLDLLAEGRATLQERMRNASVIEAMQNDIATLKAAVKYLSSELENMKKAM